jgi:hypothetical protein
MPIQNVDCQTNDLTQNHIDLPVVVAGATLTVKAGTVVHAGQRVELLTDAKFTLAPSTFRQYLNATLVRQRSSGEISVFVDEMLANGTDRFFDFRPDGPVEPICGLLYADVPANATNFDNVTITVYRIL